MHETNIFCNFDVTVYCRWFTHFYVVGSIVNSFMFLLILFSYATSSALPLVIEVSIDLLCIGLEQHVVNTGEIFCSCKICIALRSVMLLTLNSLIILSGTLATEHSPPQ